MEKTLTQAFATKLQVGKDLELAPNLTEFSVHLNNINASFESTKKNKNNDDNATSTEESRFFKITVTALPVVAVSSQNKNNNNNDEFVLSMFELKENEVTNISPDLYLPTFKPSNPLLPKKFSGGQKFVLKLSEIPSSSSSNKQQQKKPITPSSSSSSNICCVISGVQYTKFTDAQLEALKKN